MAITLEQAKNLTYGTILHHTSNTNSDGTPQRWRVNGRPKTWKSPKNAHRVSVPLKHGLYSYGTLTENDLDLVDLPE